MKRYTTHFLGLFAFFFLTTLSAYADYVTVKFSSGLNADVIANGVGAATTSTSTDHDGAGYCLISRDFRPTTTSPVLTYGLPTSGTITSAVAATTGLTFQMSPFTTPYAGNNSLRLASLSASGTLVFDDPLAAQTLYLLANSGSGDSYFTATINFQDGTTQAVASTFLPDWFFSTFYSAAIAGVGRVTRSTDALESSTTDPRMYQIPITILPANHYKNIVSVTITKSSGGGTGSIANFFAISANESPSCPSPTTLNATAITTTSARLQWVNPSGIAPLFYQVQRGAAGFTLGTGTIDTSIDTQHDLAGLSVATNYSFYVRSVCAVGDTSTWSGPYNFSTLCVVPTLLSRKDSSRCGPGIVVLEGAAETGATVSWYASMTATTALSTGATFTTPPITMNTTYYVAATRAGCSSVRVPVVATVKALPVVAIGNDTTICPDATITLNAGNPGATYLWNTTQTTQSISVAESGTYSVTVTATNGCSRADVIGIEDGIVPENVLEKNVDLCVGSTINLDAGNYGSEYSWNTDETSQTIEVSEGGDFEVVITSVDGCETTAATTVIERPLPIVNLGNDTSLCLTETIVLDAQNEGSTYLWNTYATTQTIVADEAAIYSVGVTDEYGCYNSDELEVSYLPAPYVSGFNFVGDVFGYGVNVAFTSLDATNVTSYHWDFGDGHSSTEANPVHTYDVVGQYTVVLTVTNNCGSEEISLEISVDRTTGATSVEKDSKLLLFPNPATDRISLESKVKIETVEMFDISGKSVLLQQVNGEHYEINTAHLSNGIYNLSIKTASNIVHKKVQVIR